jgi:hypothetical protein
MTFLMSYNNTLVPRDAAELVINLSRWHSAHVWGKMLHLVRFTRHFQLLMLIIFKATMRGRQYEASRFWRLK